MERNEILKWISVIPSVCFGKPCIRGHRIWVSLILDLLASGMTVEQVLEQYPRFSPQDVLACVAYGAEVSRERFVAEGLRCEIHPRIETGPSRLLVGNHELQLAARRACQAFAPLHGDPRFGYPQFREPTRDRPA
jgi:uncharacterized protein (DUF433 family)